MYVPDPSQPRPLLTTDAVDTLESRYRNRRPSRTRSDRTPSVSILSAANELSKETDRYRGFRVSSWVGGKFFRFTNIAC